MPPRSRMWNPLRELAVAPNPGVLGMVAVVGVLGGAAGAAFVGALKLLERGLWPTHWHTLPHLFVLLGVGVAVGILTWVLGSPGDVELLVDNIHVLGGNEDLRDLRSLIPVSLLCISAGGAMGPEAPLVQTTGSLGTWVARRRRLGTVDVRILTITGMAAGFTVLFGAPLGSAVFALELLHRRGLEYYEALLPAVVGSLCGYAVYATITGLGLAPVWRFPAAQAIDGADLLWAVAAGAAGAAVAATFSYGSLGLRWLFRRLPPTVRPVVGGLALGALAFLSPYALTFGEAQVDPLLARRALMATFALALVAKLAGTAVTLASGWRGGFIIPLFFMGVAMGRLGHVLFPGTHEVVLMAAAMAAANVGVTKTPLGSTIVVSEMAGIRLFPTTLVAALVALVLTSPVGLIDSQRDREGAYDRTTDKGATPPELDDADVGPEPSAA
ncbi:MAG: chloride channel protein [Acidimicrobiales bacterium]